MLKFLRLGLFGFFLLVSDHLAQADHKFCCSDTNWQQEMFDNFNTQNNIQDFSFPPGIYRKVCDNCVYDLTTVRCDCANEEGDVFHNAQMKVGDCQNIYGDIRGYLRCGD